MPRPIEMNAHDPRRYLGDMLAWLHQALASERELLNSLFGQDDPSRAGDQPNGHSDVPSSSALLDRVVEGVCRPLKVRCLHIALKDIASVDEPSALYLYGVSVWCKCVHASQTASGAAVWRVQASMVKS